MNTDGRAASRRVEGRTGRARTPAPLQYGENARSGRRRRLLHPGLPSAARSRSTRVAAALAPRTICCRQRAPCSAPAIGRSATSARAKQDEKTITKIYRTHEIAPRCRYVFSRAGVRLSRSRDARRLRVDAASSRGRPCRGCYGPLDRASPTRGPRCSAPSRRSSRADRGRSEIERIAGHDRRSAEDLPPVQPPLHSTLEEEGTA
ncbi:MAG: hypothetical protein MZU95_00530 [Desulfomicrobium escambiense]|nr:hypothetical protein [Desulfomicrobium escambiense]